MFAALVLKELRALLRDPHSLAVLFLMPMVFILIMSLALRDTFRPDLATALRVQVIDEDGSRAAQRLLEVVGAKSDGAGRAAALAQLAGGRLDAVVIVPAGFAQGVNQAPGAEAPALVRVIGDPGAPRALLERERGRWERAVAAVRVEQMVRPFAGLAPELQRIDAGAVNRAQAVALELAHVEALSSVQQSVPAWLVFAMFFVAIPVATVLITERQQRTLTRLRSFGVPAAGMVAAKFVPYFVVHQAQMVAMLLVGRYLVPLFGGEALDLAVDLAALFAISAATSAAALGLALLIASWSRTIEQATLAAGAVNILSGALGGIMVPVQVMPAAMRPITDLSPMAWGLQGFLDVFARGGSLVAVWPECAALLALGILAGLAAVWRLRAEA